jgi:hypothetical protein
LTFLRREAFARRCRASTAIPLFVAILEAGGASACAAISSNEPGVDVVDGSAVNAHPATGSYPSACGPANLQTFMPSVYHPAESPQDACARLPSGDDPVMAFYANCVGPQASRKRCADLGQSLPYAACAECIETSVAAARYGPLVVDSRGVAHPNVAGCFEVAGGLSLSCSRAIAAEAECEVAACEANCPAVTADALTTPASQAGYDACVSAARNAGCQAFATAASNCTAAVQDAAPSPCAAATLADFYWQVVPLFCQASPRLEAGSEATATSGASEASADSSSPDASVSFDASAGPDALLPADDAARADDAGSIVDGAGAERVDRDSAVDAEPTSLDANRE